MEKAHIHNRLKLFFNKSVNSWHESREAHFMEKVILVGVYKSKKKGRQEIEESLRELSRLTETAGGVVKATVIQERDKFNPATLIGKGKADEIAALAKEEKIKTIIFDEELTPAQQRNLEDIIRAKVLDRTRLILDIFAQRAHTREGRLQVELAQLEYLSTRLTGWGWGFSQQLGGIGVRGPGETKLEVESRHMRERIHRLKKDIALIKKHRDQQRKKRGIIPLPVIALIGYTNAGKSTLLNMLARQHFNPKQNVYVDDKLFATLDPTTRRIMLPDGRIILCTDTVGFIKKLPHSLIAAFRATLEEALYSDVLIHVVDAASSEHIQQMTTVMKVLEELGYQGKGAHNPALITVYNKTDALSERDKKMLMKDGVPFISARTGFGVEEMLQQVQKELNADRSSAEVLVPYNRMDVLQWIYRITQIIKEEHREDGVHLKIMIDDINKGRIKKALAGRI
jgi:GTPase